MTGPAAKPLRRSAAALRLSRIPPLPISVLCCVWVYNTAVFTVYVYTY